MMKHFNFKAINLFACFISLLILCASCEGTSDGFKQKSRKSATKEAIDRNIQEMGEKPWNKATYNDILENQINTYNGTVNAKESLKKSLDYTYGKVIVRDANQILDDCNKNRHKKLNELIAELKKFPSAEGYAGVMDRFKDHQDLIKFVSSMYAKQNVSTIHDSYDKEFESIIKKQADSYLAKTLSFKCAYINSQLNNTKSIFFARRKAYASKIVDLYCSGAACGDSATVKGKLNSAFKGYEADKEKADLIGKMRQHCN